MAMFIRLSIPEHPRIEQRLGWIGKKRELCLIFSSKVGASGYEKVSIQVGALHNNLKRHCGFLIRPVYHYEEGGVGVRDGKGEP